MANCCPQKHVNDVQTMIKKDGIKMKKLMLSLKYSFLKRYHYDKLNKTFCYAMIYLNKQFFFKSKVENSLVLNLATSATIKNKSIIRF